MTQTKASKVIDARGMEPPEPLVQTMDALETMAPGERLLLVLAREPFPLYGVLEQNGIAWQTERKPDGTVEVLMWHRQSSADASSAVV